MDNCSNSLPKKTVLQFEHSFFFSQDKKNCLIYNV